MSDNKIYYQSKPIFPAIGPKIGNSSSIQPNITDDSSYQQVLENKINQVKFSGHALNRLETRNIKLNQADVAKLNSAVDKAAAKGAKESLILMNNNLALVVSIQNRTVITAIDGSGIKDNVFTNIDSAVIV